MASKWMYSLYVVLLVTAVAAVTPEEHHVSMDEDSNYLMHWTINKHNNTMRFTVQVKTTGWVGFGISPYTGQMPGSDVVIGWVDESGKAFLQDRFASGRSLPALDSQQDYQLIAGSEKNGMTSLTFIRKFVTGDPRDLALESGTSRLIWAYNMNDPPSPTNIPIHNKMGSRSVNLFDTMPEGDKPTLPADTQTHDCVVENVTIPSKDTTYWCMGVKLPQVTEKHHIIKLAPIVTEGNRGVVHHMSLYECESDPKWHGTSTECSSENMPEHLANCRGGTIMAGWAVGGEAVTFPANAGYPLGGKNSPTFGIVEIHYDNPDMKAGIVDSSGFRISYTKQLRENDIGVLILGHNVSPYMVIPNNQMEWNITGYCPALCTEKGVPPTGINMFGLVFHTHLAGVSLNARHFRNGKELPMIAENKHYDFNYQEMYYLREEVKVLRGDILAVTCGYKTQDRNKLTIGGLSTREEMCLNYVFYYPKSDFAHCASQPSPRTLTPYFTKLIQQGVMPPLADEGYYGLYKSLLNTSINDPQLLKELYNLETYRSPIFHCEYGNRSTFYADPLLEMKDFKPAVNYTMGDSTGAGVTISSVSFVMMLAYIVLAIYMVN